MEIVFLLVKMQIFIEDNWRVLRFGMLYVFIFLVRFFIFSGLMVLQVLFNYLSDFVGLIVVFVFVFIMFFKIKWFYVL